jgi:hypothetical protein
MEPKLRSISLLVPLADGNTVKKEVISEEGTCLGGGQRIWELILRASYMYKDKHLWSEHLKKLEGL